jgi:hypothetical protein
MPPSTGSGWDLRHAESEIGVQTCCASYLVREYDRESVCKNKSALYL